VGSYQVGESANGWAQILRTPVASWNFSNGGLDGGPFGPVALTNVISPMADPLGNTHSLSVTNRAVHGARHQPAGRAGEVTPGAT